MIDKMIGIKCGSLCPKGAKREQQINAKAYHESMPRKERGNMKNAYFPKHGLPQKVVLP